MITMPSQQRSSPVRAFTLIEIVMVVAITAVILTIATPYFAQLSARQRLSMSASRVAAELKFASAVSRATGVERTLTIDPAARSMAVTPVPLNNNPLLLAKWPHQVTSVDASFNGAKSVAFDIWGRPKVTGTITIKIGSRTKIVRADSATGEVTIQ
jgi:prepilin-type N-terminal cleavage/methylation domain-containing protein